MWGMRTETVPVIVGGLGIREGMDQNLGTISEASYINKLGKIILLGTAHILRRFLSVKQKTPLVPQDQGMVPVLGECRKQLIALKTFIIMIIIMVYSQRVLLTEFTDFIYRCYCICRRQEFAIESLALMESCHTGYILSSLVEIDYNISLP